MTVPPAQLVIDNLDLAGRCATIRARDAEEWGDMYADGCIGLLLAARSFDPDRGVPFRSYARQRVQGEIIDGLRSRARTRRKGSLAFEPLNEDRLGRERRRRLQQEIDDPEFVDVVDRLAPIDPDSPVGRRLAPIRGRGDAGLIIDMLAAGSTQAEVAAVLHVTPGRISQRLAEWRALLAPVAA